MDIYIVSKNPHKQSELRKYLDQLEGVSIKGYEKEINEIQTDNVDLLIADKLIKAFEIVKAPVIVEHTGLYLDELNGFPGGLTQPFWDKLQKDKFCNYFAGTKLTAKTVIGFCDGERKYFFEGEIFGTVAKEPKGDDSFQWDCIFIPDEHEETFAEMGEKKLEISMRLKAFECFKEYLEKKNV
ncbi:non-canonical purine NTP pyrophosphatase [Acinetobacter courvalinii]|uniref:non-canonical purine NTP pyrophosphatase n=1 Tax=Acinetobacter courvalinii TaxID=280147 RepID=UPI0002D11D4A|nr:non-canonical purine NTP pyrophosphatase [Acinetobacter courvalinii]ENX09940.1 RdgB/HAM1 family non-canonical purine NTP pyrophosphatase [Acinetobacter courvalinii]